MAWGISLLQYLQGVYVGCFIKLKPNVEMPQFCTGFLLPRNLGITFFNSTFSNLSKVHNKNEMKDRVAIFRLFFQNIKGD